MICSHVILSFLPLNERVRCRLINGEWKQSVSNPYLWKEVILKKDRDACPVVHSQQLLQQFDSFMRSLSPVSFQQVQTIVLDDCVDVLDAIKAMELIQYILSHNTGWFESLTIIDSEISNKGLAMLNQLHPAALQTIQKLHLEACHIDGAQAGKELGLFLNEAKNMQELTLTKHFYFEHYGVQGMVETLQDTELRKMKLLAIIDCRLKAPCAKPLAQLLQKMPNIQSINLQANELNNEGLTALGDQLHTLPELTTLDISYCGMGGPVGAEAIVTIINKCAKLTSLKYHDNNIKAKEHKKVQEAMAQLAKLHLEAKDK